MTLEPLSQNDKRWGNIFLGFSKTKIKNYGCLITSLSILYNTTPDKVNTYLKKHDGFVFDNLVVWTKCPGFVWRSWKYDNDKVKEIIKKQGGCIVEVDWDGSPKTSGSHFIVFIGNRKSIDVWNGKIEPTSKYKLLKGYAEIDIKKGRQAFQGENMSDCLLTNSEKDKKTFEKLVKNSSLYDEIKKGGFENIGQINNLIEQMRDDVSKINDLAKIEKERADEIRKKYKEFIALVSNDEHLSCVQEETEILAEAKKAGANAKGLEDIKIAFGTYKEEATKTTSDLNVEIARLKALLKHENVLKDSKFEELLKEIIKRLVAIVKKS